MSQRREATRFVITSSDIYRFSEFFHWHTLQEICDKAFVKDLLITLLQSVSRKDFENLSIFCEDMENSKISLVSLTRAVYTTHRCWGMHDLIFQL